MAIKKSDLAKELLKEFKDWDSSVSNWSSYSLKQRCDTLAGYAYVALKQLEDEGRTDFLFLKHDNMRNWYTGYKDELAKREEAVRVKARKAEIKAQALLKLTEEEKQALGIKK